MVVTPGVLIVHPQQIKLRLHVRHPLELHVERVLNHCEGGFETGDAIKVRPIACRGHGTIGSAMVRRRSARHFSYP
jgi:hypothetical protein